MRYNRSSSGFTLVELAVAMTIVALVLSTLIYTLSAQHERFAYDQTQRRLEAAREAVLAFAVAQGRLPCPASATSNGLEDPASGSGACASYDGFLPAVTLGFQPVDGQGYAVDAWTHRIRYAVAGSVSVINCSAAPTQPHFTVRNNLKLNGMSCQPGLTDLLLCRSSTGAAVGSCGAGNSASSEGTVAAVIWSAGKNYASAPTAAAATAAGRADEAENLNGNTLLIAHLPTSSEAAGGEYDDMLVWIPASLLYGRLVTAGVLP